MGGTPNVPVDAGGAGASAPAGTTSANLSDDQILDSQGPGSATPAPGAPAGGGEAGAGADAGKGKEAAAGAEGSKPGETQPPDQPEGEFEISDDIKAVFAQPGVGPKVRDLAYREAAYREVFPTVAEARELRSIVPDVQTARAAVEARDTLDEFDQLFYSSNPKDHATFAAKLAENDPKVFPSVVRAANDRLYELDRGAYMADTQERLKDIFHNLRTAATAAGDERGENTVRALDVLARRLFGKTLDQVLTEDSQLDPHVQNLERQRQELSQREQEFQTRSFTEFYNRCNDTVVDQVVDTIRGTVDTLLKDTPAKQEAKDRIIGEIYKEVDETLRQNRELRQQLRRILRDGKQDPDHQGKVVQMAAGRAKLLVKQIAPKVVNRWTNDVLAWNKASLDKQNQAAGRTDITGGQAPRGAPGGAGEALSPDRIDYSKTSDDDILSGKVARRA